MKRNTTLFFLLCLALCCRPETLLATKASPPVVLFWTVFQEAEPGRPAALRLTCTPDHDVAELELLVTLPKGWKLVAGSTSWKGAARAGRPVHLDCSVEVPAKDFGRIVGTMKMPRGRRGRWVHSVSQAFNAPPGYREKVDPPRRRDAVLGRGIRAVLGRGGQK